MKQYFILFLLLLALPGFSQSKKSKNADKFFEAKDYATAVEAYKELVQDEEDPGLRSIYRYKIGESYKYLNKPENAERAYQDAIKAGYLESNIYLSLGEVQLKQGKYEEALSSFESYKLANPGDPLVDVRVASCQFAKENLSNISLFELSRLNVNSGRAEFGVSFLNESLLFTSTRSFSSVEDEEDDTKEKNKYEDRVIPDKKKKSKVISKSGLTESNVMIAVGNNGKYNRAQPVADLNKMKDFADDGVVMYDPYSRQAMYTRKEGKKAYIYFLILKNVKWEKNGKIEVDSKGEPIGHPYMTPDGNRIYFTSTMPGGMGKSDIWYIEKNGPKSWSTPINAGDNINTAGNEVYPFIAGEYLFFASDGRVGFGGMDIYAAKMENGIPRRAVNIGAPFNSSSDDLNLVMRADLKEGVLVSGRNPKTQDDIYQFKGFPSYVTAIGSVKDGTSNAPVSNVTLELFLENKSLGKTVSDEFGNFMIPVTPNTSYTLTASSAGYSSASKTFTTGKDLFGRISDVDFKLFGNASVLSGRVADRLTAVPMEGEVVNLISGGKIVESVKIDPSGIYKFSNLKSNTKYEVRIYPKGYFGDSKTVTVGDIKQKREYNKQNGFDLDLNPEKYNLNKEVLINNIEFQEDKANLLSDSFKDLDRLAELFQKNPQCEILISGYVDLRTVAKTADPLSIRRANVIRDYFVSKGVSPKQLSTKGYGRSKPLILRPRNDEEHQSNNRITYMVVRVKDAIEIPVQEIVSTPEKKGKEKKDGKDNKASVVTPVVPEKTETNTAGAKYDELPWRVQVSALRVLDLKNRNFVKIKTQLGYEVHYDLGADGMYRYYIGGFETKTDAQDAVKKLKSAGIDAVAKPKW